MNADPGFACNYAVLHFIPYPETGEFVNLGVLLHCASAGLLTFRVETSKHKRVTDFFPELDLAHFRQARAAIVAELERVERLQLEPKLAARGNRELGRALFLELVRPRESIFRFGEIRTILAHEPQKAADLLFERYVERQFAQPKEYQETVMVRRYLNALKTMRPGQAFERDQNVGTEEYHVRLPICSRETDDQGIPRRVLKPLNLRQENPSAVIDRGDAWIARVRRLKGIDHLPERFVFAVNAPPEGLIREAAADIIQTLRKEGVSVGDAEDTEEIVALTAD